MRGIRELLEKGFHPAALLVDERPFGQGRGAVFVGDPPRCQRWSTTVYGTFSRHPSPAASMSVPEIRCAPGVGCE